MQQQPNFSENLGMHTRAYKYPMKLSADFLAEAKNAVQF